MRHQLGAHQRSQLGIHGGEHLGQHFYLADFQAAHGKSVGHFQSDIAGSHDQGAGRGAPLQGLLQGEGVTHGVQQVDPVGRTQGVGSVQAGDRRPDRPGAGADHQPVVRQGLVPAVGMAQPDTMLGHIDPGDRRVQAEAHAGILQLGGAAVGQVAPVGHLSGDVVRDATDGEIRVGVGHHHRHRGVGVELPGSQGGRDARVRSADGNNVHEWAHLSVAGGGGDAGRKPASGVVSWGSPVEPLPCRSISSGREEWGTTTVAASAGDTSG